MTKQYFQQPNQVMVTRHRRNFDQDHEGTDLAFGTLAGYPCCFSNMHQGWPKFTQHLWYATPDNGIAAIVYSPSEVTANVGDNVPVVISEDTYYPMDHQITFTIKEVRNKVKQVKFPFHLRVPKWCKQAEIRVNGKMEQTVKGGKIAIVDRYGSGMIRLNCICPWRSLLALGMKTQYLLKEVRWYMPENGRKLGKERV